MRYVEEALKSDSTFIEDIKFNIQKRVSWADSSGRFSRPEVGDLLIRRVILQFRRAYKRHNSYLWKRWKVNRLKWTDWIGLGQSRCATRNCLLNGSPCHTNIISVQPPRYVFTNKEIYVDLQILFFGETVLPQLFCERNDKIVTTAAIKFMAHLVNQKVRFGQLFWLVGLQPWEQKIQTQFPSNSGSTWDIYFSMYFQCIHMIWYNIYIYMKYIYNMYQMYMIKSLEWMFFDNRRRTRWRTSTVTDRFWAAGFARFDAALGTSHRGLSTALDLHFSDLRVQRISRISIDAHVGYTKNDFEEMIWHFLE